MDNTTLNSTDAGGVLEGRLWIWRIIGPLILVAGTIGNIVSAIVFCRPRMRRTHIHIFFTALAVNDLIALYVQGIPSTCFYGFENDIRVFSSLVCKLTRFGVFFFTDSGVWILVLLTLDRTIAISYPMSIFQFNAKSSKIALLIMYIVLFSVNAHLLYGYHLNEELNMCSHVVPENPTYSFFTKYIWVWIDLAVYSFIPVTVLIISDTKLILSIMKTRSALAALSHNDNRNPNQKSTGQRELSSVIPMLVATGVQHIVTTSPVVILLVYFYYTESFENIKRPDIDFGFALTRLLSTSNNALNVITYCCSGRRFRQELKAVFWDKPWEAFYNSTEKLERMTLLTDAHAWTKSWRKR